MLARLKSTSFVLSRRVFLLFYALYFYVKFFYAFNFISYLFGALQPSILCQDNGPGAGSGMFQADPVR